MIQTRPNELRPDEPAAGGMPGSEPQDRLRQHADDIKRQAGDVRQAASEAVSQAGEKLSQAGGKLREAGRQAKDQVVETARQTTSQVRERASDVLAAQKSRLADEVSVFAEALHKAADTLDQNNDAKIGRYVHQAADCIDSCVNYLHERDASEMVRKVGAFTRRHPEVVLGGMFLAGVAIARFLKASDRNRMEAFDHDYSYMDTGRGLESGNLYGYDDAGYGDVGMYAGDDVSGIGSRGMNEPFGAAGGAGLGRDVSGDAELDDIARRDDLDRLDEITGLAPISRENRGQLGDADLVPDLPREEASLTRNTDIPSATAPQPGSYPPVTPSGTFFESTSGQAGKSDKTTDDDLSTIGRNDPSCPTNPSSPR